MKGIRRSAVRGLFALVTIGGLVGLVAGPGVAGPGVATLAPKVKTAGISTSHHAVSSTVLTQRPIFAAQARPTGHSRSVEQ